MNKNGTDYPTNRSDWSSSVKFSLPNEHHQQIAARELTIGPRVATRPASSGNVPISSTNVPRPGKTMVGTPNVPIFRSDESSR